MIEAIGVGAGSHAKVVIEILQMINTYKIIGLLDTRAELWGQSVFGIPILGNDELLPQLYQQGVCYAFIGLGTLGNTQYRKQLCKKVSQIGFQIISAIHPQSIIASSVQKGQGLTVMAGAIVNSSVRLGNNVIVNTGAIIEHDCIILDHVHIATAAKLAGNVLVGENTHIGIGATIRQNVQIGSNAIIGAGAVVVDDVPDEVVVVGVPARFLKKVGE